MSSCCAPVIVDEYLGIVTSKFQSLFVAFPALIFEFLSGTSFKI